MALCPVSWYQKKHSPTHTHEEEEDGFAQTTRSALSQQWLPDPVKPAYYQSRLDGRLKLTASAFNLTMDQYAGSPGRSTYCYAELAVSFINFLHYCSPSSGFYGAWKDSRGRRTDNPSGLSVPHLHHPPIFMPNALSAATLPSILAWDRHQMMLACIPSGLACKMYNK